MGVHGLWELLAPVGRRVSVETLSGKRLAIDASIWMVQFMKAMRDDKGEMVRNAHILGFFRRICKLLFLRTKPVFVFDGATPALKRRTVMARRRQREDAQSKIRKTAEKLLLKQVKRLKELTKEIEDQRQKNDKGKRVLIDETDITVGGTSEKNGVVSRSNQEELDELLAASLAAEEDKDFSGNASTSAAGFALEEDDCDEDEEMMLPTIPAKVDPAVLASLPPSMQLDLLVQMRERLMAENRQKYQRVKKAPEKFSELQIQAYLKTVAFRREIDEVQKAAAGRGVGGVQTSRIASEANREFIFSSSFTGDKGDLTSAGKEGNESGPPQMQNPSGTLGAISLALKNACGTGPSEPDTCYDDDVETYLDERGRVRVSRVRAMGMQMTRDLQRNLDMMKEVEQETINAHKTRASEDVVNKKVSGVPRSLVNENKNSEASENTNSGNVNISDRNKEHNFENGGSIVVSFEVDGENKNFDGDDDLFAHLVAEDPEMISSGNNTPLGKHSIDSASDSDWEEGVIEENGHKFTGEAKDGSKLDNAEGSIFYESEVEWEEGTGDAAGDFVPCPVQSDRAVSKGSVEEDADLQEAIRRSLEDLRGDKIIDPLSVDGNRKNFQERTHEKNTVEVSRQEDEGLRLNFAVEDAVQQKAPSLDIVDGVEMLRNVGGTESLGESLSFHGQLAASIANDPDMKEVETDKPYNASPVSCAQLSNQSAMESIGKQQEEIPSVESVKSFAEPDGQFIENQLSDTNNGSSEAVPSGHYSRTTNFPVSHEGASVREMKTDDHVGFKIAEGTMSDIVSEDRENLDVSAVMEKEEIQDEALKVNLEEEMRILDDECMNLGEEQRKLERNAESVNSEMFAECQELLQMFGLPYIIAPMEAEAQCAYMELANLVDGVVTDDSDVFLFGAQSVYKNLFDDRKYVETYLMKDIESELGLTREKLIRMALLLGSDYTEGISGIGIVNAIEVVNAFPEEDGLHKFREWVESPDPAILGKLDTRNGSSSRKRESKTADGDVNNSNDKVKIVFASDSDASQVNELNDSKDPIQSTKQIYMETHRNVSKNWHIPPSFPSEAVLSAYFSPQVDSSTEPFSWGKPDLFVLRRLCWEKFGWASQKADELLLPVLKEYDKHETQLRLEAFYTFNEKFAKIRSKRIKKAVKGITGSPSSKLMDDHVEEACKGRKKRGPNHSREKDNETDELSGGNDMTSRGNSNCSERTTPKKSRKRKNHRELANTEAAEHDQASNTLSRRSRNSGKGRGRGSKGGKGRRADGPVFAEASSNRGGDSGNEQDMHLENSEAHVVRRSTRLRKPVSYIVNDSGYGSESSDQNDEKESSLDEDLVQYAPRPSQLKNQSRYGDSLLFEGKESSDLGGGFCTSDLEAESMVDRPDSSEHAKSAFEDEISKEYLKMGGGFCHDEDETGKAQEDYGSVQASATILDHADFAHSRDENHTGNYAVQSGFSSKGTSDGLHDGGAHVTDIDQDVNCSNVAGEICHSADAMHLQNGIGHDSGTATVKLSPMPFLRRKRRKS